LITLDYYYLYFYYSMVVSPRVWILFEVSNQRLVTMSGSVINWGTLQVLLFKNLVPLLTVLVLLNEECQLVFVYTRYSLAQCTYKLCRVYIPFLEIIHRDLIFLCKYMTFLRSDVGLVLYTVVLHSSSSVHRYNKNAKWM
jgi:hypothetical protein